MFASMFKVKFNVKRSISSFSLIILFILLMIVFSSLVLAESNLPLRASPEATSMGLPPTEEGGILTGDSLTVINSDLINNLTKVLQPLFKSLSLVLGGIFGVYLIMVIFRLYYERKKVNLLKAILYDLDKLNEHYKISNSKSRQGWLKRVMGSLKKLFAGNRSKK